MRNKTVIQVKSTTGTRRLLSMKTWICRVEDGLVDEDLSMICGLSVFVTFCSSRSFGILIVPLHKFCVFTFQKSEAGAENPEMARGIYEVCMVTPDMLWIWRQSQQNDNIFPGLCRPLIYFSMPGISVQNEQKSEARPGKGSAIQ